MDCNTWYKSSFSVSRAYVSEDYNNGILYQIWVVYICLNIFVFEYFYLWSFWSILRSLLTWMSDINFYWIELSYLHFRFIWCLFNFCFFTYRLLLEDGILDMFRGVNIHVLFYIFSGFQVACFIYQELGDVREGPDILDMRSEGILGLHLGSLYVILFIWNLSIWCNL
jgi:hypothetical protein